MPHDILEKMAEGVLRPSSKIKENVLVRFDEDISKEYGVKFLDLVETIYGHGYIIGKSEQGLYLWIDNTGIATFYNLAPSQITKLAPKAYSQFFLKFIQEMLGASFSHIVDEMKAYNAVQSIFENLDMAGLEDGNSEKRSLLKDYFLGHPKIFAKAVDKIIMAFNELLTFYQYKDKFKESMVLASESFYNGPREYVEKLQNEIDVCENYLKKNYKSEGILNAANKNLADQKVNLKRQQDLLQQLEELRKESVKLASKEDSQENDEKFRKFIGFLLELLLEIVPAANSDKTNIYNEIFERIGTFIYDSGLEFLEDEKQKNYYSLLLFILGNANEKHKLKKACYVNLLAKKGVDLDKFDIVNACKENPQECIDFLVPLLIDNKQGKNENAALFYNVLNELSQKKHLNAKFGKAKLHLLLSQAYESNNQSEEAKEQLKLARTLIIEFMKINALKVEFEELENFVKQYFNKDFTVLVLLANYYFKLGKNNVGLGFLAAASESFAEGHADVLLEVQSLYANLLVNYSQVETDKEKGLNLLIATAEQDNQDAFGCLRELAKTKPEVALALARLYFKKNNESEAREYFGLAEQKYPEASFCIYKLNANANDNSNNIDIIPLIKAAKGAYGPAIEELKTLVSNNLVQILNNSPEASFFLAEFILENNIDLKIDPIELLQQVACLSLTEYLAKEEEPKVSQIIPKAVEKLDFIAENSGGHRSSAACCMARIYCKKINFNINYKEAARYFVIAYNANPTVTSQLVLLFKNNGLLEQLDAKVMKEFYIAYCKSGLTGTYSDEDFAIIAKRFLDKKDAKLNKILLKDPKLRQQLAPEDIITLLDSAAFKTTSKLSEIIAQLISETDKPGAYFNWLNKKSNSLLNILNNADALELLKNVKAWQEFLRKIDASVKTNNNSINASSTAYFSFFATKQALDADKLFLQAKTDFSTKKSELMGIIASRMTEPGDNTKLLKALSDLNKIDSLSALQRFMRKLSEQDKYFEQFEVKEESIAKRYTKT